jgi:hypothetical protein
MLRLRYLVAVILLFLLGNACGSRIQTRSQIEDVFPDLYEASVEDLQQGMEAGQFTSVDLVKVGLLSFGASFKLIMICCRQIGVLCQDRRSQSSGPIPTCCPRDQPFSTLPSCGT